MMRKTELPLPNTTLGTNLYVAYNILHGDSHFVYAKIVLRYAPFSPNLCLKNS